MNESTACMVRKPWGVDFTAEPRELAALRRIVRLHLQSWGLHDAVEAAQVCVSELVANVVAHVGVGTPTSLMLSVRGTYLRIEVRDPDARALPTLLSASADSESGRGVALVDATADRWGVQPGANSKIVWCELATGLVSADGHQGGVRVARAETLLSMYDAARLRPSNAEKARGVPGEAAAAVALEVMADVLHWLRAHGCDPEVALERAQERFELTSQEYA
ncbi:ATP-binding protein [Streptomyces sp. NPDC016845]|uniref:ATP-binding protein n=1 Tax=Streptomyces sp. NPDC016845 TaxID=3364972 RepID=UPI00378FE748